MKLLNCLDCHDIFLLTEEVRWCRCRGTAGRYTDHVHAVYCGHARVLGIRNSHYADSIKRESPMACLIT